MVTSEFGFFSNDEIDRLQCLFCRSETKCNISICVISLTSAMKPLHHIKFGGLLSSTSAVNSAQLCTAGIDQHSG